MTTTADHDATITLSDATKLGLIDWWGDGSDDPPPELAGASLSGPVPAGEGEGPGPGSSGCACDWPAWAAPCPDHAPVAVRYAVHPGHVRSQTDGQLHFVGFGELVRLYGVPPGRCVLWDDERRETYAGRDPSQFVHLRPTVITRCPGTCEGV